MYLRKADEFLLAASISLEQGAWNAVASNAVHAGISSMDAVASWTLGERASSDDHGETLAWLKTKAGRQFGPRIKQLEHLLGIKTAVQYGESLTIERVAKQAHQRAKRLVEWAHEVVREGS